MGIDVYLLIENVEVYVYTSELQMLHLVMPGFD